VTQLHNTGDPAAEVPAQRPGRRPPGGHAERLAPSELVAARIWSYADQHPGHRIEVLEAGCGRRSDDLGVRRAHAGGLDVHLSGVDDDAPLTQAVAARRTDLDTVTLGDLRTVPLRPRSFDIVHCDRLLERIPCAELVLDRLVNALKPGGLLVLRMADRDCASGFIDRKLPGPARRLVWRWLHPGRPGPYPAVYDVVVSRHGIHWFTLMRGLAVVERRALAVGAVGAEGAEGAEGAGQRRRRFAAVCGLVAWLSRGHITAGHDELLMVIKKPENRFARVLP
jgi:SAM-dependent methyltransferase